jgi:hypothetical protein
VCVCVCCGDTPFYATLWNLLSEMRGWKYAVGISFPLLTSGYSNHVEDMAVRVRRNVFFKLSYCVWVGGCWCFREVVSVGSTHWCCGQYACLKRRYKLARLHSVSGRYPSRFMSRCRVQISARRPCIRTGFFFPVRSSKLWSVTGVTS